uniref:Family with sequence similarity 117 member A n=1 Tax=Amphilophus citrinellus TaxID=61819 RepID=A0A3Q0RH28_AMPCI
KAEPSVFTSCGGLWERSGGMSSRSGGAPRGCSNPSLQPLRATVPYQLQRGSSQHAHWLLCIFSVPKADRNTARPPKPTIRRTVSLDAIVGPYLQGQWPREAEGTVVSCVNDKATQTPSSWAEETRGRRSVGGHKRSASWGSAEHLREASIIYTKDQTIRHRLPQNVGILLVSSQTMPLVPLNRLAPRLRRSVEGLNLELEEVFVCEKQDDQHEILDIPDGHRAPVPAQRCSSGSQSEPSPGPLDPSLLSPSQSPCIISKGYLSFGAEPVDYETLCPSPSASLPSFALDPPLLQPCSSSPRPNKTYSFQREPPEGCERVRVCEEASLLQPSCPDPNKVNFTPHGGSAFCPVSLLKPLLPSMDLLFRGLSVSPVTGCSGQASPTRAPAKKIHCDISASLPTAAKSTANINTRAPFPGS